MNKVLKHEWFIRNRGYDEFHYLPYRSLQIVNAVAVSRLSNIQLLIMLNRKTEYSKFSPKI